MSQFECALYPIKYFIVSTIGLCLGWRHLWHIEEENLTAAIDRRHYQINFLVWKCYTLATMSLICIAKSPISNIQLWSDIGSVHIRQHAISSTKDDIFNWCIYALLGIDDHIFRFCQLIFPWRQFQRAQCASRFHRPSIRRLLCLLCDHSTLISWTLWARHPNEERPCRRTPNSNPPFNTAVRSFVVLLENIFAFMWWFTGYTHGKTNFHYVSNLEVIHWW